MPRIGEVIGLKEFNDRLDEMTYLARQQVLVKAVREGGKLIQDEIEHRAKHRTGKLAANIGLTVRQATGTQAVARIGPAKFAFYGKFPETGTKFQNPFTYIRPAFEAKFPEAFAVALYFLDRGITKRGF
jgi:HK97 gp10 family phage protein